MKYRKESPIKKIGKKIYNKERNTIAGFCRSSREENRMFRVWLKSINTEWNAKSENNSLLTY